MNNDASLLAQSYLAWLRRGVTTDILEENVTELTTPFLDRHNDHIQIYAERMSPDFILLTDDGYIMAELKSSGVESHGPRREELISTLLRGYGVSLRDKELQVTATQDSLGQATHNLVQAMLSLDDMFVLAQPNVESVFVEDVAKFLDTNDIRYSPRIKLAGKSGLDHLFDFVIPKSREAPERILKVVNSPRRDRAESLMFAASDTRSVRGSSVQFLALVNDTHRTVSSEILDAFRSYDIRAQPWSRRGEILGDLAA